MSGGPSSTRPLTTLQRRPITSRERCAAPGRWTDDVVQVCRLWGQPHALRLQEAVSVRGVEEVAASAGISWTTLKKIACGRQRPTPRTLTKISKALGVWFRVNVATDADVIDYFERGVGADGPGWHRPLHFFVAIDATPDAIKQRLWECGTSLAQIAAANGVDRRALGRAIAPVDEDGMRQMVADAVGLQLHEIWPSLYRPDGSRKAPSRTGGAAA